jgi:hypothetical protein
VQNGSNLMVNNSAGATAAYGAYITNNGATATTTYGTYIQGTNTGRQNYGLYLTGVNATSGNYSIYSDNAAQSYFAGNIGIGTSSPAALLQVTKDANTSGQAWNNLQVRIGGATNPLRHLNLGYDTTGNFGEIQAGEDGVGWRDLVLNWDGGNVGIATSTPGRTLTVVGDIRATGILYDSANSAGTAGMVLQTSGTGYNWVATSTLGITGGSGVSGGTNGYVARFTSATALSTGLFLDNGTVAGVNATNATTTLLVKGNAGNINPFTVASSTGATLFNVTSAGNVGINTTTPAAKLSLQNAAGTDYILNIASSSGTSLMTMDASGNINMKGLQNVTWDANDGYGPRITLANNGITIGNNAGGMFNQFL